MKRSGWAAVAAAGMLAAGAVPAAAQVHVTPVVGVFVPASDLHGLRAGAEQLRIEREGTFGAGLNVDAGWLRGSVAYATGARLTARGVENREELGDGSVLAVAADLVVRPLPRVLVQPYLLGGAGLKQQDYSWDREGLDGVLPRERRDVAAHIGVGADLMVGGVGLVAEISDYVTRRGDGGFGQHDAFAFVGLRLRVGGR